jgi:two-component system chemotaxis response regulator CheY
LFEDFLVECGEHLATVETDLLGIENRGAGFDEELVNHAFRAIHSIKGGASLFDLIKIRDLAHQTEDVLGLIRSHEMVPTPERVHVLLNATDKLQDLVQNPATSNQADIAGITAALASLPAALRASAGKSSARERGRALQDGSSLRVLLVEDDFASRLLLQTFLSRYGECHIAVNGREAVDAFRAAFERGQRYHLVCMDIMMPEMDGREAVRHIRVFEESHGILSTHGAKIVMTTTVDDIKEVSRCFLELCDAYLMKPIDLAQLLFHLKSYQLVQ